MLCEKERKRKKKEKEKKKEKAESVWRARASACVCVGECVFVICTPAFAVGYLGPCSVVLHMCACISVLAYVCMNICVCV